MPPQEEPPPGDAPHPGGEQGSEKLLGPGEAVLYFFTGMAVLSFGLVLTSGRTVPYVLYGFLILGCLIFTRPRVWWGVARLALCLALWLSILSPVDVTIQRSDEFNLRFVRVATCDGCYEAVRRFEAQGLKENIDFVVYKQAPGINYVEFAVVFFVPWAD